MIGEWLKQAAGGNGQIDFLQDDYLRHACSAIRLPEEITQAILQGAERIRSDGALTEQARQFHRELFIDKAAAKEVNDRLLAAGPHAGIMAAIVYIGSLPQLAAYYESKGIPDHVLVETLDDMAIWMRRFHHQNGEWGLGNVGWLINHCTGRLFRLGRLQFIWTSYKRPFKAFRHRASGCMTALSDGGIRYRGDGQADGTNGVYDPEQGWETVYEYDGATYKGHPVSRSGAVRRSMVSLPVRDWDLVLTQGDPVLDVHIPEGSKMTHELCRDSYRQAVSFGERHFPEKPFQAFVCSSWLFAPQFPLLLPSDSNIVRFQQDYYVTPVKSDENQTLERVFGFGTKLEDLPCVPRETSLQRIVYDHLAAGGAIHGAAAFMLKEDCDKGTAIATDAMLAASHT